MSPGTPLAPDFQTFDFTHEGRTHEVFQGGSGPAVLVLHEIPGMHPGVIDFARRLVAAGYTVYMPSLFGPRGPSEWPRDRAVDPAHLRGAGVHETGRPHEPRRRMAAGTCSVGLP